VNFFGCISARVDARVPRDRIALVGDGQLVSVIVGSSGHDLARRRYRDLGDEAAAAVSAEDREWLLHGSWSR
jgi:hypothetical protein